MQVVLTRHGMLNLANAVQVEKDSVDDSMVFEYDWSVECAPSVVLAEGEKIDIKLITEIGALGG